MTEREQADEDSAALLAVLAVLANPAGTPEVAAPLSVWPAPQLRGTPAWAAGPGRWWASGLPG